MARWRLGSNLSGVVTFAVGAIRLLFLVDWRDGCLTYKAYGDFRVGGVRCSCFIGFDLFKSIN